VLAQTHTVNRILVIDNGSQNDSFDEISSWLSLNATSAGLTYCSCDQELDLLAKARSLDNSKLPFVLLIRSSRNRGFSGGFNIALRILNEMPISEAVVLLNSDAILPNDFAQKLLQQRERHPQEVGLVGPRILDSEDHSDWQRPERFRPSVWLLPLRALLIREARARKGRWSRLFRKYWYTEAESASVFMVHGACLILCKPLLRHKPLLDEELFLYWEEAVLSELVISKELKVWYDPAIEVYHGWGKSTPSDIKMKHLIKSTKYYFKNIRKVGLGGMLYLHTYLASLEFILRAMRFFQNATRKGADVAGRVG
jgi:GT2 family glycosyltransferase